MDKDGHSLKIGDYLRWGNSGVVKIIDLKTVAVMYPNYQIEEHFFYVYRKINDIEQVFKLSNRFHKAEDIQLLSEAEVFCYLLER